MAHTPEMIADAAEQMARENNNANSPAYYLAHCRGMNAAKSRARDILEARAAQAPILGRPTVAPGLVIDPPTPAGAQVLASIAPREPRMQRDTGICNRCGYDRVECGC